MVAPLEKNHLTINFNIIKLSIIRLFNQIIKIKILNNIVILKKSLISNF